MGQKCVQILSVICETHSRSETMKAKSSASIASCVNVVSTTQMQRKCISKDEGIVCNTRFVDMSVPRHRILIHLRIFSRRLSAGHAAVVLHFSSFRFFF